jgi:putative ABC transport system permease protein
LRRLVPRASRDLLVGDLDEEFEHHVAPGRTGPQAAWWYWKQALRSAPGAFRLRWQSRGANRVARDPRLRPFMARLIADFRYGVRRAASERSLVATVTLTLGLGLAAATSVLALTRLILLQPLPYRDPRHLVHIAEIDTRRPAASGNVSYPDFLDYRAQNQTMTDLAAFSGGSRTLSGAGEVDRVPMAEVSDGFFRLLGVRLALGREFDAADLRSQAPLVAVLTDGTWRRRFGADLRVVGRTVGLSGQQATIAGVLPPEFEFPLQGLAEIYLPLRPGEAQIERRYMHWLDVIGRLRPGASIDQAAADLDVVARRFASIDPQYHPAARTRVVPLSERVVGAVRPILSVLLGAAAFVLVVACANIAGLLVARDAGRLHEVEVRSALGATRVRLIRQLMTESLVLALPGALLGLVLGHYAVRLFVLSIPPAQRASLPHLGAIAIDPMAILASLGLVALSIAAFGVLPAWQVSRQRDRTTLGARGAADARRFRLQSTFLVSQLALAVVLLAGSALIGRSVYRLVTASPGFAAEGLLTARVNPAVFDPAAVAAYHERLTGRIGAIPAISGVATISQPPLGGPGNSGIFTIAGGRERVGEPSLTGVESSSAIRTVSVDYFRVMAIPVLQGRAFTAADRRGRPPVVVVNRTLASAVFGGGPIGHRIVFPFFDGRPAWEIVGVVGDEQVASLDQPMRPVVYFPFAQAVSGAMTLVARTTGDPEPLVNLIRSAAVEVDPTVPVYAAAAMDRVIADSPAVFRRRSVLAIVTGFAAVAVLLSAVGLYGALAQAVAHRTREIGVRIALGARRPHIARDVLRRGLVPVATGLGLGLAATWWLSPALETLLFGIAPRDWPTLTGVAVFLFVTACLACAIPARRAVRIDPAEALRQR